MRYLALALLLTAGILARTLGMTPGLPNLRGFSGSANAQAAGLAANATPIAPPPPQGACPSGNGLFVLYYGYIQNPASTDPTLQTIVAGQPNFVVVGDGLGGRSDIPAYLHQSGVRAIQYVPLNYAAAPAATVDAAIDTAMGAGYDGIFFDQVSTASADSAYQSARAAQVKSYGATKLVIMNPGVVPPDPSLFGYADIVSVENQYAQPLPTSWGIPAWRWLAVQGDPANLAASSAADAENRLTTFRTNGGFWYYSSYYAASGATAISLPSWYGAFAGWTLQQAAPACGGSMMPTDTDTATSTPVPATDTATDTPTPMPTFTSTATATPTPVAREGVWSTIAPMITARNVPAAAAGADGRIYAIGGNTSSGYTAAVEAYSPTTMVWSAVDPLPTALAGPAAATGPDGRIYVIGGTADSGFTNTVEAYDPSTNTWSVVAAMHDARTMPAAATGVDGRVYAIGGSNANGLLNTVEAYDPQANSWTVVAPMPTARVGLAAAAGPEGRIYAIGGTDSSGMVLNTVEAYDPGTNSWTTVAPMPTARTWLAAATGSDGRIYAIGGFATGLGELATVEAYDPGTNTWSTVAPMSTIREELAAAGIDGRIYAIGGDNSLSIFNSVEAYQPVALTPTASSTPTGTATPTSTDTATDTPSLTDTPTATDTASPTATDTPTVTDTATVTPPLPTATRTPTSTRTPRPTRTATNTRTPTATATLPPGSIRVDDFGARADGITDSTSAFRQALVTLQAAGGGTLVLSPGTYLVAPDSLNLSDNMTLSGANTTLRPTGPGFQLLDIHGSAITVSGVTLDGNAAVVRGLSIEPGSSHITITRSVIQGMRQSTDPTSVTYRGTPIGAMVYGNTNTILFDHVTVRDILATNEDISPSSRSWIARGILITGGNDAQGNPLTTVGTNVTIQRGSFANIGPKDDGDAIVIQPSNIANAGGTANLRVLNNTFFDIAKRAVKIQVGGATISGNTITNDFNGNNLFTAGPNAEVQSVYGPDPNQTEHYDVYSAISVYAPNVRVTNNLIAPTYGTFYRAVEIAPSSFLPTGVANEVVTGNQIAMGSAADPSSGLSQSLIRLDTGGLPIGTVRITNNILSNAVYGVSLTAAAAQSTKVTISGNTTQNVFAPQVIYG